MLLLSAAAATAADLPPLHTTVCAGGKRPCRPGEGNPTVTHSDNPYTFNTPSDFIKAAPNDPRGPAYKALVTAATAVKSHHHLLYFCVADFDFRELAENWHKAISRFGTNALVYALEPEAHAYLTARQIPSVDGSANLAAWRNRTRLSRHMQRVDAEKHVAAAALAAAGFDVLLTDATHVMLRDATPSLHALSKVGGVDAAVARIGNSTGKPPLGVGAAWSLVFLRGTGSAEERELLETPGLVPLTWQPAPRADERLLPRRGCATFPTTRSASARCGGSWRACSLGWSTSIYAGGTASRAASAPARTTAPVAAGVAATTTAPTTTATSSSAPGNHCILGGFQKLWQGCNPTLEAGVTPEAMAPCSAEKSARAPAPTSHGARASQDGPRPGPRRGPRPVGR